MAGGYGYSKVDGCMVDEPHKTRAFPPPSRGKGSGTMGFVRTVYSEISDNVVLGPSSEPAH